MKTTWRGAVKQISEPEGKRSMVVDESSSRNPDSILPSQSKNKRRAERLLARATDD